MTSENAADMERDNPILLPYDVIAMMSFMIIGILIDSAHIRAEVTFQTCCAYLQ